MSDHLAEKLKEIVGPGAWEDDEQALELNLTEWRGVVRGKARIMVSPADRERVAEVVRACGAAGVGIVPQGGNTGMCAGAVPDASGEQVILNLSRLNKIRAIDPLDFSMIAEAGCVLADIQAAARDADRFFPLSHGGEGSCQIGGNLSTNAGGINVLRYGTTRHLVLGVEVVLADGTIWHGINTLRKDTAGYDLKHLFIGSEGSLGIITAVALKLFPIPGEAHTALVAIDDVADAVSLLGMCRTRLADDIQAFELIGSRAFEYVLRHIPDTRLPFGSDYPWYVLIETANFSSDIELQDTLTSAADDGLIVDAVIAKNASESAKLWRMRHSISEAEKLEGAGAKHDIAVPIGKMKDFLLEGEKRLGAHVPDVSPVIFGHVGDGNLHYNMSLPQDLSTLAQERLRQTVSGIVYDLVTEMGGSISAEHGVGVVKKPYLEKYKSDVELRLMRSLKTALDPGNILNPGKVI